ncbi:hypothetical protein GGR54DRAFT_603811 [Hypoxylon sp. NC1633]|nr:hypothetical protein GGR54DRAFT_603811 [Hypoxylon sp. NC1633]
MTTILEHVIYYLYYVRLLWATVVLIVGTILITIPALAGIAVLSAVAGIINLIEASYRILLAAGKAISGA